jgi:hypothetical protein
MPSTQILGMGVAPVYTLETRVLLDVLSQELQGEALLAARLAIGQPEKGTVKLKDPASNLFQPFIFRA